MKIDTLANHFQIDAPKADNEPLVPPIYQSVKFTFDGFAKVKDLFEGRRDGYFYSRYKNPTVKQLEQLLAQAQGTESGLATGSGVAAISTALLSLLKSGDQIVYFIESYRPTRTIIENILGKFGVKGVKLSLDDMNGIENAFKQEETKFVIWESPTNPQLKTPNNRKIIQLAKEFGVTSILDNTFAGFHKNRDLDVDLYIHSLTKYACGHGDAMGGVILGSHSLIKTIHKDACELGPVLDPNSAYLILRGMKTYQLRYERQSQNASKLASWLSEQEPVEKVFFPTPNECSKDEDLGTVLMFNLKDKEKAIEDVIDKLQLFTLSASLGSTESLVAPALYFYGGDLNPEQREKANLDRTSIRLSLGIENCDDLIQDLQQALHL